MSLLVYLALAVSCFGLSLVIVHVATVEADARRGHNCRLLGHCCQILRCAFGGSLLVKEVACL